MWLDDFVSGRFREGEMYLREGEERKPTYPLYASSLIHDFSSLLFLISPILFFSAKHLYRWYCRVDALA